MNKLVAITILILMVGGSVGYAQNDIHQDTLVWSSDHIQNLKNGDDFAFSSIVKTYSTMKVEWIQKNGEEVYVFNISSASNTWSDTSLTGKEVFQIQYEGKSGELIFERTATGNTTIVCDLRKADAEGSAFRLNVVSTIKAH